MNDVRPITLAMVTPFPEERNVIKGGVEAVALSLVEGLKRVSDINIHIVSSHSKVRRQLLEERDDLKIHWLPKSRLPGFLSYWSTTRIAIHNCLRNINPDITHFQGAAGWTLAYRKPFILTIHGIYEKDVAFSEGKLVSVRKHIISNVERVGRHQSPSIILISPYVTEELKHQIKGECWNIENPITSEFFDVRRDNASRRILYVGRINARKNVMGLLRVFRIVHSNMPDATLHIAGLADNADYHAQCIAYAHDNGLEKAVVFLGNVSRNELQKELSKASCLVLISFQETAPMVIEESMAAGVPVVGSNICGLPFMIDDGETGFLVNPNNEEEIAQRVLDLLKSQAINNRFSEACKEVAKNRFHNLVIARKTLDVYYYVLDREGIK